MAVFVVVAAGCDWASVGFDLGNTRDSTHETVITPANLPSLKFAWSTNVVWADNTTPVVAGGVLYEVVGGQLLAMDAKTGVVKWKGQTSGGSSATVANGKVYVSATGGTGTIVAFNIDTCKAVALPATCSPQFHTAGLQVGAPPIVSGKYLYAAGYTTNLGAAVWDADGVDNCSVIAGALSCSPLAVYTSPAFNVGASATPSLGSSQNRLFVPYGSTVMAYRTYGTTGCSGAPTVTVTCGALRTYKVPLTPYTLVAPTVRNDVLYMTGDDGKITAFDALGGSATCSHTPKTCTPIWQTSGTALGSRSPLAVSDNYAYVNTTDGFASYGVRAVNLATHALAWTGTKGAQNNGNGGYGAVVAGGVLFIGSSYDHSVYGYDASGCGHATCDPLWHYTTGNGITGSPVVADGMMYVASSDGFVRGFELP